MIKCKDSDNSLVSKNFFSVGISIMYILILLFNFAELLKKYSSNVSSLSYRRSGDHVLVFQSTGLTFNY